MHSNPISASVNFDRHGVQHGFLRLPWSRDDSAWGAIMIPVSVFVNGSGPNALLTGGNHGDEYEGPVTLFKLARQLDIAQIQGRVIIVPAMNYPAFAAGSRVSPIDQVNLNRAFPGRPDGSVTQIIADYFSHCLLPMADYVLDIHSGGKTLDFLPFAACHRLEDSEQEARCEAAMRAFGAPYLLKMLEIDAGGMYDTQAEQMGKVFVTTELGGGGTTRIETLEIALRGSQNFLRHAGILAGDVVAPTPDPINLDMPDNRSFLFAEHSGLMEPCVALGSRVKAGDRLAVIHATERTSSTPHDYFAQCDGLIIARHHPSLIKMGDCINVIAEQIS